MQAVGAGEAFKPSYPRKGENRDEGWAAAGGPEALLSYLYPNIYTRMLSPARDSRGYNQAAGEQRLSARKSLQE